MKHLKTISFSIQIKANRKKVWKVLWNPETYKKWTGVFAEGSHYEGELKQGNTIHFLGSGSDGMIAIIEKMVENEQMVFSHQREVKNGVETDSLWQGAKEIYYLKEETGTSTELQVIMDVTQDMEEYFSKVFPEALRLVKQIAEQ
ncbi:SRPBCC domain-containing protein [Pedobacter sp. SD-b]|uniref:SRPBCC domain-containing protein n=1 Tax=Pedobacter segetis TaxID=2793069 RepID=A0ABS1BLA8_9SPHI|nr:SRPBCC domain-containing protein [Pedobacter segetis]MBK0383004.1 SRPBCC domain-containing protein [Pedobacter segetis]